MITAGQIREANARYDRATIRYHNAVVEIGLARTEVRNTGLDWSQIMREAKASGMSDQAFAEAAGGDTLGEWKRRQKEKQEVNDDR